MDNFEPLNEWEYGRMMDILNQNSGKTFVQRILRPNDFPTLDNGDGSIATHRMAWGQMGDKFVAFPTVLYDGTKLVNHGPAAWDHAIQSKNYIEFDNQDEASWFAQKYKGAWGGQMNKPPK